MSGGLLCLAIPQFGLSVRRRTEKLRLKLQRQQVGRGKITVVMRLLPWCALNASRLVGVVQPVSVRWQPPSSRMSIGAAPRMRWRRPDEVIEFTVLDIAEGASGPPRLAHWDTLTCGAQGALLHVAVARVHEREPDRTAVGSQCPCPDSHRGCRVVKRCPQRTPDRFEVDIGHGRAMVVQQFGGVHDPDAAARSRVSDAVATVEFEPWPTP